MVAESGIWVPELRPSSDRLHTQLSTKKYGHAIGFDIFCPFANIILRLHGRYSLHDSLGMLRLGLSGLMLHILLV